MSKNGKTFTLILPIIIATLFLATPIVKPVNAELMKTSTPEFSIKYIDGSYDIPSITSIDPFTGQPKTTPIQHINNQTITVTIKDKTGLYAENNFGDDRLYYQIQMKGYYSQEWANISFIELNLHSEYTVVSYAVGGNNAPDQFDGYLHQITSGGTVDFRVQTQYVASSTDPYQMQMFWLAGISDWTPTLTIPLTNGATSSSIDTSSTTQSPNSTPTVPELSWLAIVSMLLSLLSIAWVVKHQNYSK